MLPCLWSFLALLIIFSTEGLDEVIVEIVMLSLSSAKLNLTGNVLKSLIFLYFSHRVI